MAEFEPCFKKMIVLEGGFHLHKVKGDAGGMTYAGVARNRWPQWPGWQKIDAGEFDAKLTGMVKEFYKNEFWDKINGDSIGAQDVACQIFIAGVNTGLKTSVRLTQKIIGAVQDGVFGEKTFRKLNAMVQDEKDERIFVLLFSLLQIFRYKDICLHDARRKHEKFVSDEKFLCGWINRVQEQL